MSPLLLLYKISHGVLCWTRHPVWGIFAPSYHATDVQTPPLSLWTQTHVGPHNICLWKQTSPVKWYNYSNSKLWKIKCKLKECQHVLRMKFMWFNLKISCSYPLIFKIHTFNHKHIRLICMIHHSNYDHAHYSYFIDFFYFPVCHLIEIFVYSHVSNCYSDERDATVTHYRWLS